MYLLKCVWTYMITNLKQVDIVIGQHIWTSLSRQIKNIQKYTKTRKHKYTTKENNQATRGETERRK